MDKITIPDLNGTNYFIWELKALSSSSNEESLNANLQVSEGLDIKFFLISGVSWELDLDSTEVSISEVMMWGDEPLPEQETAAVKNHWEKISGRFASRQLKRAAETGC
ncbi:hypothetical protein TNCV_672181 [Trichonephila clavipes]|nr:hypothetical protein TNCV_672181 [Trichonephila clavipes]